MMLPFEPQALSELQTRFSLALAKIWNQRDLIAGMNDLDHPRPGTTRANVFDCVDGWRLIVSQEATLNGGLAIHMSGSVCADSPACDRVDALTETMHSPSLAFQLYLRSRFKELCQDDVLAARLDLIWISTVGIPHFKIDIAAEIQFADHNTQRDVKAEKLPGDETKIHPETIQ